MSADLCFTSVIELARLIRSRELSAREVMAAFLTQIERLNPTLNAIVSMLPADECLALADAADRRLANGAVGPLHGLPFAFKDAEPAVGFPFTRGSPIFRNDRPASDSALVARLRAAGVVPIGKTNVSEFTMGSHTYNPVFGTTVNPYDPARSAGGSSGGAAAAVAAGLLPAADGSDVGGSLRNPASFNNLVALRPSPGLVPNAPSPFPLLEFLVKGPIARTVDEAAFMLSVMAGQDESDPRSWPSHPARFAGALDRDFRGQRVAWCPDLGGLPLDPAVRAVVEAQRAVFESLGCVVEDAAPDFGDADEVFVTLRAWMSAATLGPLLATHRAQMKPEAIWQIELGQRLSSGEVASALRRHGELLDRMRAFQTQYAFMVCTVSQVAPFDARIHWPQQVDGVPMEHYIAWMKSAYLVSAALVPALAVPAGFVDDRLPVGIQIVGRRYDDLGVLQLGRAFERATGAGARRPGLAVA